MTKRMNVQVATLSRRIEHFLDRPDHDLDGQLAAAREWIAIAGGDPGNFERIMDRLPPCAPDWLLNVPSELVGAGRVTEAHDFVDRMDGLFAGDNFLADLAVTLAHAHPDAARRQVELCRARYPDDPWVRIKCGEALAVLGLADEAESEFRRALALAGDDAFTIEGALERFVPFLESAGRDDEARALRIACREACAAGECEDVRA